MNVDDGRIMRSWRSCLFVTVVILNGGQGCGILKETPPGTIPARFGLIWFCCFRGKDLNVIFYQNMPNLDNWYKSAERQLSQKNPEYMLNYSLPCSCS
jgi:hypothetical protein